MNAGHGGAVEHRRQRAGKATGKDERASYNREPVGDRVMAVALRILAARPCSEADLRDRLISKRAQDPKRVEDCIKRLKEMGYVNDDLFARSYANYRVGLKPLGRTRLARELAVKKVARDSIEAALDLVFEENAEETLIDRAIARRVRTHGRPADRAASKRMFDHLARLGFEYDLVVRKLRGLKAETRENDD
jgi:regulatory protein